MAYQTSPVQTCVLRVGIKCCKGCQTSAKRKLLSVDGVSGVEYNAEQGLLSVRGDVDPAMLLHKLSKWGKSAELVYVLGETSVHVPRTPEHNQTMSMEKKKKPTKCCFLVRCFGKPSSKAKVEPLGQYHSSASASATPLINDAAPPMGYPPPQGIPGFPLTPIPYPPPSYFAARQPPYTAGVFRSTPPQSPPYIQFPEMVNSRMHYPHH